MEIRCPLPILHVHSPLHRTEIFPQLVYSSAPRDCLRSPCFVQRRVSVASWSCFSSSMLIHPLCTSFLGNLVSPRINPLETQRFCHLSLFGDSPPVRIETVVKIDRQFCHRSRRRLRESGEALCMCDKAFIARCAEWVSLDSSVWYDSRWPVARILRNPDSNAMNFGSMDWFSRLNSPYNRSMYWRWWSDGQGF